MQFHARKGSPQKKRNALRIRDHENIAAESFKLHEFRLQQDYGSFISFQNSEF